MTGADIGVPDRLVCEEPIEGITGAVGISNGMINLGVGRLAFAASDCG